MHRYISCHALLSNIVNVFIFPLFIFDLPRQPWRPRNVSKCIQTYQDKMLYKLPQREKIADFRDLLDIRKRVYSKHRRLSSYTMKKILSVMQHKAKNFKGVYRPTRLDTFRMVSTSSDGFSDKCQFQMAASPAHEMIHSISCQ